MADYNISIKITPMGLDGAIKNLQALDTVSNKATQSITGLVGALNNLKKIDLSQFNNLFALAIASCQGFEQRLTQVNNLLDQLANRTGEVSNQFVNLSDNSQDASQNIERTRESCIGLNAELVGMASALQLAQTAFSWTKNFVNGSIQARSYFQTLERQLGAVLGSAEAVNEELPKLRKMANTTPNVDTEGAVKGVATFMRMGDTIDEARHKMETLANATAFYGGTVENVKLALVQFEQMANKDSGWGEDIRSLTNHLPGIRDLIKQKFGTTDPKELKELGITSGKQLVEGIFEAMEKINKVDGGISEQFAQLHDNIMQIRADIGEQFLPAFNLVINLTGRFTNILSQTPNALKRLGTNLSVFTMGTSGILLTVAAIQRLYHVFQPVVQLLQRGARALITWIIQTQLARARTNQLTQAEATANVVETERVATVEILDNNMQRVGVTTATTTVATQELTTAENTTALATRNTTNALAQQANQININNSSLMRFIQRLGSLNGRQRGWIGAGAVAMPLVGMGISALGDFYAGRLAEDREGRTYENYLEENGQATAELRRNQRTNVGAQMLQSGGQGMAIGAGVGASLGMVVGSIIPVIGTVLGGGIGTIIGGITGGLIGATKGLISAIGDNREEFKKLTKAQRDARIEYSFEDRKEQAEKTDTKTDDKLVEAREEVEKLQADLENAHGKKEKETIQRDLELATQKLGTAEHKYAKYAEQSKQTIQEQQDFEIEINNLKLQGRELDAEKLIAEKKLNSVLENQKATERDKILAQQEYQLTLNEILEKEKQHTIELEKQAIIQKGQLDSKKAELSGNGKYSNVITAQAEYDAIMRDPNATQYDKEMAGLNLAGAKNSAHISEIREEGALLSAQAEYYGDTKMAKNISAWYEYQSVVQDVTKSNMEKATAWFQYQGKLLQNEIDDFKKAINEKKKLIDDIIRKREQQTNSVISEIERERNAMSNYRELGQQAYLTSAYFDTSLVPEQYSSDEIMRANARVNIRKQIDENKKSQVDFALYGNTTNQLKDSQKSIENMEKNISQFNITGQQLLYVMQQVLGGVNNVSGILAYESRKSMA